GQSEDNPVNWGVISKRSLSEIEKDMNSINEDIEKKSIKILAKLQKQESKLKDKLASRDGVAAESFFPANDTYKVLAEKIKNGLTTKYAAEYIAQFDSLKTGLKFLEQVKC